MHITKKIVLSVLVSSSLLLGLGAKPTVAETPAETNTETKPEEVKVSSFVFPESLVTSFTVANNPTVNAEGLYLVAKNTTPPVNHTEVVMTEEEIVEAVDKTPTAEDIAQDPQPNPQPAPEIEDTLPDIDSEGVVETPSSSEESSSEESSSEESSSEESSSEESSSGESSSEESSSEESSSEESSSEESSSSEPSKPQISNGWYSEGGTRYYYYGGKPVTGWQTIGGRKYYFANNGVLSSKTGIDISTFQKSVDWSKLKADGIDFVILRAGYRGWGTGKIAKDAMFESHYAGARAAGLEVGVYFYSQAITVQEARDEANFVIELLKTHPISGPVAFDIEGCYTSESRVYDPSITDQDRTNFAKAFCDTIRSAGYTPQVYTYLSYAYNDMYMDQLTNYQTWIAHYTSSNVTSYKYPFKCWQYTSSGSVKGISGGVDMNIRLN